MSDNTEIRGNIQKTRIAEFWPNKAQKWLILIGASNEILGVCRDLGGGILRIGQFQRRLVEVLVDEVRCGIANGVVSEQALASVRLWDGGAFLDEILGVNLAS